MQTIDYKIDYKDYLQSKVKRITKSGFNINTDELNENLFDFQKYCVKQALKAGKFAMFEDCGLGKTLQQLEFAYQVIRKINKPALILAPLGVIGQTIREGNLSSNQDETQRNWV